MKLAVTAAAEDTGAGVGARYATTGESETAAENVAVAERRRAALALAAAAEPVEPSPEPEPELQPAAYCTFKGRIFLDFSIENAEIMENFP